jgi:hypothetical protein
MRCSSCHHENRAAAHFCQECGNRLRSACGGCGTELPPAPEPAPGSFAGGCYQLRELLGEGARKRVHLAWDTRLERFFGRTVNLAARIAAQAEGEEILVSATLAEQLKDPGDARFGPAREVDLNGISERQRVHIVEWS